MQCIRSVDCLPKDRTHRKNVMYTVIPAIQWSKYKIWPIKVEKKAALIHTRAREKSNTATRPEPQTKKQRLQTEPASQCAINETFFSLNANICVIKCEVCHFCPHLSHRLNFDAISNIRQPKPSQSKPNQRLLQPNRTKSKTKINFICVNFIEFRSMQNVQTTNYTLDAERIVWNVTLNAHYKKSLDIAQPHTHTQ